MRVRRCIRTVGVVLGFGAILARALAASADPIVGVDDKWRHLRSPNFELFSRQGEDESRELLANLELLRAVCLDRLKLVERRRLDVTVYLFRTAEDFRAYGPAARGRGPGFKGYYLPRPDRAVIALTPMDDSEGARRLIFHEYVHHVIRAGEDDPPLWFNEGMAELLAGLRPSRDTVEIGHPHASRLITLRNNRLLPLETLFAASQDSPLYRSADHTGVFYAQAWALLHYWYFGDSKVEPANLGRFLRVAGDRKAAAAADLRALFRECFGVDYAEMERRLERYVTAGSYRYGRQPRPALPAATTYVHRAVPREEIRVRLAELSFRTTRSPAAKLVLLEAIEKTPGDPRPFEVLGTDATIERNELEVRERWEQAVTAGSTNVAVLRELALMESRGWFQQFDYYFRLPPATVERLRSRLHQSIAAAPEQSTAYEMLAWVEAYADEPSIQNVNLVQERFNTLKQPQRTLLALAFVRVRMNKPDEAKAMLAQLERLPPETWTDNAAETLRARIEGRPPRRVPRPSAPLPGAPRGGRPPLQVPSLELPGGR